MSLRKQGKNSDSQINAAALFFYQVIVANDKVYLLNV